MTNKVYWGIEQVHYALLDETTNTFAKPVHLPGAVNLGLSNEGDASDFFADNIKYFNKTANNGYTGDLEMAKFPDEFLIDVLGWEKDTNGVVLEDASAIQKPFALLFQIEGDATGRRYVYYNTKAAKPNRSHATQTESVEPGTETSTLTMIPHIVNDKKRIGGYIDATPENSVIFKNWFESVYLGAEQSEGYKYEGE